MKAKTPVKGVSASGTGTQQDISTTNGVQPPQLIISCPNCKGTGKTWIGGGYTYGVDIACIECCGKGRIDEKGIPFP